MLKRPRIVGTMMILIGLFGVVSTTSKWYFQHDPLPIALSELVRNTSGVILFIFCGLVLLKAPNETWRFRDLFETIVRWAPLSYRYILLISFIVFMLATMFSVFYSIVCITGQMCQ